METDIEDKVKQIIPVLKGKRSCFVIVLLVLFLVQGVTIFPQAGLELAVFLPYSTSQKADIAPSF